MEIDFSSADRDRQRGIVTLKRPLSELNYDVNYIANRIRSKGDPIGSLANKPLSNTLENDFRRELYSQKPISTFVEGEQEANKRYPVTRTIYPLSPQFDAIDQYELGFLHKDRQGAIESNREDDVRFVQNRPSHVLNVASLNYILYEKQRALLDSDEDRLEYFQLTPEDLFKDWSLDGVIEATIISNLIGGGDTSTYLGVIKEATVVKTGPQKIYDYWEDWPKRPGTKCYFMLKKFPCPEKYQLRNRYDATTGNSNPGPPIYTNVKERFMPYQLAPFTMPLGGPVPPFLREYKDESGYTQHDGMIIEVGTVSTTPVQPRYKQDLQPEFNKDNMRPFIDSNVGINETDYTMLTIMLDCRDPIGPF